MSQRHLSEEIFYDSLGVGIQIHGAGEPKIRAYGSADLAPKIRRHHSRGDRIQSKWRDPNPRGILIRAYML